MSNVLPSQALHDLITIVWSQPSGQIFLLSVAYYLLSAFAVSGYMAYFAGGFGNIGFGDYSIIDFLFFLPTVIVTGLSIVIDNFWHVIRNIFFFLFGPNFLGVWVAYLVYKVFNPTNFLPPIVLASAAYIAFVTWLVGFSILLSDSYPKKWIAMLLQFLGALLFSIAAVGISINGVSPISPNIDPVISGVIIYTGDLLFLITRLGGILLVILLIGMTIARESIKYKYLSRIMRVQLSQPVAGFEKWRIKNEDPAQRTFRNLFKPTRTTSLNYEYALMGEAFLIASLKRVTAVYINPSDGVNSENGRLILISNTEIQSLELRSGKRFV